MAEPTMPTPTRTGIASMSESVGAAVTAGLAAASSGLASTSDGSGSISVPTFVPGAVAKP